MIGDDHRGFRRNRSTTDQIFCIRQILEKKWEYNETVQQLFIDFKKAYDSLRRDVLYNVLVEFGVPMEVVRLVKLCLNEKQVGLKLNGTHQLLALANDVNLLGDNLDAIKKTP
jgi:hypothetical protein